MLRVLFLKTHERRANVEIIIRFENSISRSLPIFG